MSTRWGVVHFTSCGGGVFTCPSRSVPGTRYRLIVELDGTIRCGCKGHVNHHRCYHARELADQLDHDLRCRRCGHLDEPGDRVTARCCVNLAACLARSQIARQVLEWARRYYPDADSTFNRYWDYYRREFEKSRARRLEVASA